MMKILDHGTIYRNPEPHRTSEYVAMPCMVAMPDDTLVCACRHGSARESVDGVVKVHRSTDGGATWQCAGVICEPGRDADGPQWPGGLAVLPDREVVACVKVRPRIEERGANYLVRSQDGGRSWSPPEAVTMRPYGNVGSVGNLTGLADGTLIATGEGRGDGKLVPEEQWATLITRSADRGRTWDDIQPAHVSADPYYFDLAITQLADGRLLAAYWTHDMRLDRGLNVHLACSADLGRTWTEPWDGGFWGQRTDLVTLRSGRVIAVTNHRRPPLGIRALQSEPDGTSFRDSDHVEIWGIEPAQVRAAPVLEKKQDREQDALHAWHHFTFGVPAVARLSDGVIVVAYYVTEDSVTYVRCCRMVEAGS